MIWLWLIIVALVHSKIELEIEGHGCSGGWARNLPTKRYYNKVIKFLVGKELTTYHVFLVTHIILLFHGYFLFRQWSIPNECYVLSLIVWYLLIEDFGWFILNKKIGFKGLFKTKISWHKRIWLYLPVSYWWSMILGTGLLLLSKI